MDDQSSMNLFSEENYIKGRPLVSIFHNDSNLYSVVRIRVVECNEQLDEKEAVVTGYFPKLQDEETYTFFGEFKDHPKFGRQFIASRFEKELPQTKNGIISYLSSDLFNGIGKKTAEKIVEHLGENAISTILQDRTSLESVPNLAADKAKTIYQTLMEHQGLERVMIGLSQLGFGPQLSMKIYQEYQETSIEVIQKNPYQLVEDIEGIGFGKADELGKELGLIGNHPARIRAACMFSLELGSIQEGHVYVDTATFIETVKKLLETHQSSVIEYTDVSKQIIELGNDGKLIVEDQRIYLPSLYYSEKGIVSNIQRLLDQDEYEDQFPESEFLLSLGNLEERIGVQYASSQRKAIQTALMSPCMILTGGPGTGKTTVIKGIVELYADLHGCSLETKDYGADNPFPIILTAPTGRAAKRMSESTGLPAMTIHRLLGMNGSEDQHAEDEDSKTIDGKMLIVDEMSMVDTWLAHQLLKALPSTMQVIFVGDEDQLPSVGPGLVLKDMIQSKAIPMVQLTDIYRQEDGSSIIELAHSIKRGTLPNDLLKPKSDRAFITCTSGQIPEVIEKVVGSAKRKGYHAKDIQVLAPMYRGPAGINKLNQLLQEILNANDTGRRKEIVFGDITYRIGDKVLQLVNQPEQQVFNGDIGEIISIFYAKENTEKQDLIVISFEGIEVTYQRNDFTQFTHAFCTSIHKSQGSEFPIVILPVVKSYYRMLRRNLLYTGITRSRQSLILCGEIDAFKLGIEREDDQKRHTTLADKLSILTTLQENNTDHSVKVPRLTLETVENIDPMIGMENISPYEDKINEV